MKGTILYNKSTNKKLYCKGGLNILLGKKELKKLGVVSSFKIFNGARGYKIYDCLWPYSILGQIISLGSQKKIKSMGMWSPANSKGQYFLFKR